MFENIKNILSPEKFDTKVEKMVNERVINVLNTIEITKDENTDNFVIKTGGLNKMKGKKGFTKLSVKDFTINQTKKVVGSTNSITINPPYDYDRIDKFFQKEAYFARAISRQYETMLRNGYGYISDNPDLISVVRKQIINIEKNNGGKTNQLVAKIHMDLSKYGISIIHKEYLTIDAGTPDKTKKLNTLKTLHPANLTYYFHSKTSEFLGVDVKSAIADNESLGRGMSNRLQRLIAKSKSSNKRPDIPSSDLVVLKVYQDDTNFFPEPPSMQILDDILTLRSIEETIELLVFQYGSPILHGQVGTDDDGARTGEVDLVRNEVENMSSNGFIVTDHRVKFTPINLLNNVGDFTSLLSYFKTRILIGSGSSGVSVGEGDTSNRSTANSIDDGLADHCMFYSGIIAFMFNYHVIPEILFAEKQLIDPTDDDGDLLVELIFNEVKLDKQIAMENSIINLFNSNLLPHNRAIKKLKQIPLKPEEESELYVNKVQIPLAEAGKALTPGSSSSSNPGASSQPSNQHGKKAGPGSSEN